MTKQDDDDDDDDDGDDYADDDDDDDDALVSEKDCQLSNCPSPTLDLLDSMVRRLEIILSTQYISPSQD